MMWRNWLIGLAILVPSPALAQDGYNFSGTDAAPASTVASQTGVSQADLDNLDGELFGPATEGSAIQQQVSALAGQTITFRYDFISEEGIEADQGANDVAFYAVGSDVTLLADTFDLVGSSGFMFPIVGGIDPPDETGYQTASIFFENDATVDLTIGVLDTGDRIVASVLLIDEVRLVDVGGDGFTLLDGFESGLGGWSQVGDVTLDDGTLGVPPDVGQSHALLSTASVPEPSLLLLLGAGAIALLCVRARG